MRRSLFWLHRYLGLVLVPVVLLLAVTGSALVFRPALEEALGWRPQIEAPVSAYSPLVQQIGQRYPGAAFSLRFDTQRQSAVRARVETPTGRRELWLHPQYATILQDQPADSSPFEVLQRAHDSLFLGETGETLLLPVGVGVLLMLASGLYVWWPASWRRVWRLRRGQGWRVLAADLHRISGFACVLLLLPMVLSGLVLAFYTPLAKGINHWQGHTPLAPPARVTPAALAPASADLARLAIERQWPGAQISELRIRKSDQPWRIRVRMAGEIHPIGRSYLYWDPYRAQALRWEPVANADPATRWLAWAYPLHSGRWGDTGALRWLVLLCGVLVLLLAASGAASWYGRRKRTRQGLGAVA